MILFILVWTKYILYMFVCLRMCVYVKRYFDSFRLEFETTILCLCDSVCVYIYRCAYVCVCKERFWFFRLEFWSSVLVSDQCLLQTEQSNLKNTVRWFQVQTSSDLVSCFFLSVCDWAFQIYNFSSFFWFYVLKKFYLTAICSLEFYLFIWINQTIFRNQLGS